MQANRLKRKAPEAQVQDSPEALRLPPAIDPSDLGIEILVDPPNPAVDIIAVHGLGATPSTTWTKQKPREPNKAQTESAWASQRDNAEEERINWLSHDTMLPAVVKNARIMAFNYDSNWYGPDAVKVRLDNVADEFIDIVKRARGNCAKRPLILIGHCFGGLVIEKALIKRRAGAIFDATTGVVLLGTPHRGTDEMTAGQLAERIIARAVNVNPSSLTALRADNELIFDTVQGFVSDARERDISIHCFFETKASIVAKMFGDKTLDFIVDEKSARIDGCRTHGLPLNHYELNKFSNPKDGNWNRLCGVISDLCKAAPTAMIRRHVVGSCDPLTQTCLRDLRTTDPREDKKRIEGIKGGLLRDSYRWILEHSDFQQWRDDKQSRLLWIRGDPGKGKTMLLCGIIDELTQSTIDAGTVSYFFCQATDSRINSGTAVLRGLIYLLANRQPALLKHVREKYDTAGKALFEDVNAWVALCEILTNILQEPGLTSTYLVIDALDECKTDRLELLQFIDKNSPICPRVKWIISSRNWPDIEERLNMSDQKVQLRLELNKDAIAAAVSTYIECKVGALAWRKKYSPSLKNWVREYLSLKADATFLWVALVLQELEKVLRRNTRKTLETFPPGLDPLYRRMMEQVDKSDDADLCKRILSIVAVVYRPITLREMVPLDDTLIKPDILEDLSEQIEDLEQTIGQCGSFLTIRDGTVYFVHQSAKDFLLREASNEIFSGRQVHHTIFSRSLQAMSKTLRRDIYNLRAPGVSIDQVKLPDSDPLAAVRYSCLYWVDHLVDSNTRENNDDLEDRGQHLQRSGSPLHDGEEAHRFLQAYLLYWLEALGWMGKTSEGIQAILSLETHISATKSPNLHAFVYNTKRFALYNRAVIEQAPLQLYCSALVFAPEKSIIRATFEKYIPAWIFRKPKVQLYWSAALQTLEGHSSSVSSVVFSPDGTQLMSGSHDTTIQLWDTATGAALQTLKGHSSSVSSIAFSPDGIQVVSGSNDTTIRLWDTSTGAALQTLKGHSSGVSSVAFSPDSTQVVSGSNDTTVRLWDAATGAALQTLEGHSSSVSSVAFSPDGTKVVSGSHDTMIRVWEAATGTALRMLEGHSSPVSSIAFSPDSVQVVSGSHDNTVRLWDAVTGAALQTLRGHFSGVSSVAFSSNGTQVASGSNDTTVQLWDAVTGAALQTLEGHSSGVSSVAFSPDGTQVASGSNDTTVRLWDAVLGADLQTLEGHSAGVWCVAFSSDGTQVVSGSSDHTVRLWDAATGVALQTLEGHSKGVKSVAFSPDRSQVVSGSNDRTVRLWDAVTGATLQTLKGHSSPIRSVAISPDGTQVVSGSNDRTVRLWDAATGAALQTFEGHSSLVRSVAFSPNGKQVVSGSWDTTVRLWDAATGAALQTLEGHSSPVRSVAFSPDGTQVVSGSCDAMVRLWDAATGAALQSIEGYSSGVSSVAFSPDGKLLSLRIADSWIVEGASNILWLPPDYRATGGDVWEDTICWGQSSGRILFLQLKQGPKLIL